MIMGITDSNSALSITKSNKNHLREMQVPRSSRKDLSAKLTPISMMAFLLGFLGVISAFLLLGCPPGLVDFLVEADELGQCRAM